MKKPRLNRWQLATSLLTTLLFTGQTLACTTFIITPGATASGAMYVGHSDDGHLNDPRLIYVPAADHPPGSMRPVHFDATSIGELPEYGSFVYRRYTGSARGPGYKNPNEPQSKPIGFIPQVAHTYGYFDGNYGIMNEHQLMFGECTNGTKMGNVKPSPKHLFYSAELARVALERCTTAREAVVLIGHLIDTYGFHGTGETLPVADPKEGWLIEMIPGDETFGGLWVAQRIPDGEMVVSANELRIREIDPDNPDQLFSPRLHQVARAKGWWKPEDGKLDWLRTVSLGEYNHPYYSLRRVWRVMDRLAPSLKLSPWVEDGYTRAYPLTIKPDQPVSRRQVLNLLRDHYEGTEFDMTKGVAAGPFGLPYRYLGPYESAGDVADPKEHHDGAWQRPLSVYYCTYSFICEGRSWLPDPIGGLLWFGLSKPAETAYTPIYVGSTRLAAPYTSADPRYYSRDSAFWAFNFVENWATINYSGVHRDIVELRDPLEQGHFAAIAQADKEALALYQKNPAAATSYLTEFSVHTAEQVFTSWQAFGDRLIVKYADGGMNSPGELNHKVGYPKEWLESTDWKNGPTSYARPAAPQTE
ncbi:dipeptidase [Desulfogranum mediterraneum]|uniref:dipeptidase n=1 Tax=Desulfogranum mediterraneum TaxID=160661 RepID=UPI000403C320|nr:C69 family dipeptidase [Desulfogranum mediterraneum]